MADKALAELQDQQNKVFTERIQPLRDKFNSNGQKWSSEEDRSGWEAANNEYQELETKKTARRQELTTGDEIDKAFQRIEAQRRAATNDARIGLDEERRREENPELIEKRRVEDCAIAFQAWGRSGVNDGQLSKRQIEACERLKFNPRNREISTLLSGRYGEPAWTTGGGRQGIRQVEHRVGMDVATTGAGLETIPEGFMPELEVKLLAFGGPRSVCRVIRTASGNALPWPTWDDTSNSGAKLAEATTIGTSVDPTTAAVTFNAYKYSSKPIFISQELLEDSAFNLAVEIGQALGTRLGRGMGAADTTGDGSGDPNGIVTAATSAVTAASTTAFTADELIDLVHTLDPAYRVGNVGFMMHDTTLKYVRKFKDANGQYLWQPGMQAGVADSLYGYGVTINQHMSSTFTTGQKLVLFANFDKFILRDVAQLRFYRLDERYRDTDQTAFIAFMRHDADTIMAAAIRLLLLG